MKSLLTITAFIEVATGLALLAIPSLAVSILLGTSLTEPSGIFLGRIGGAMLISLAMACWLSRNNAQSSLVMIKVFVLYNIAAASLLAYAGLVEHFTGLGLWPAILLHTGLLVWCVQSLRNNDKKLSSDFN